MHDNDERAAVDINDAKSIALINNGTSIGVGHLRCDGTVVGPFTGNRHERRKAYAEYRKQESIARINAALIQRKTIEVARKERNAVEHGERSFNREVERVWGSAKEAGHAYATEERRRQEYSTMHHEGSQ